MALSSLLLFMCGCGSCDGGNAKLEVTLPGGGNQKPIYNGLVCEAATSAWRCESTDGASLDFALYFLTADGIAVLTPATDAASTEFTFEWAQPQSTRVEITADDGQKYVAVDIDGSTAAGVLDFVLQSDGEPDQVFHCELDRVTLLDADCDGKVDAAPTPVPTPTATPAP